MSHQKQILPIALGIFLLSACATDDPNRRAKTGAAIGAVTGAVIGNQSSSKNGKYVGAVIGALSGAAVGNYMDKQQRQLERDLALERRKQQISVVRIDEETLRLDINSEASFDINSATLSNSFQSSLNTMAEIIGEFDKTAVHIIGHTDSTGSKQYNQTLSQRRARSVATHFAQHGVFQKRLRTTGRGENSPRFDNSTNYGRRMNRRVEIYLKTITKGREAEAFRTPHPAS
ncbi:MAG: OmpA family protein [Granulosicoccus sp.]